GYRLTSGMQANNRTDDVEGDPDRVDPLYQQGKVACGMFLVLLILSFLVIGIVTGLNFSKKPKSDETRGLLYDENTPVPLQHKGPCLDGWMTYSNSCYLLVNAYVTWDLSMSLCRDLGAYLMVVNNKEELEFISSVVQMSTDYWIGFKRDKMVEKTWVNGDDNHSTSHFWNEDPDDEESCVYLEGTDTVHSKQLHDPDCKNKLYYICEHQLKKSV
ncbi:putative C-type lectin domain family 4 member E-like, partial [Triplophysa rosa]